MFAKTYAAFVVAAVVGLSMPAQQSMAEENWKIGLRADNQPKGTGWFVIHAWGKNVSGDYLHSCSCQLSVSGNATIQPNSEGSMRLSDTPHGETRHYRFVIYAEPGGGEFTYQVEFVGYVDKKSP